MGREANGVRRVVDRAVRIRKFAEARRRVVSYTRWRVGIVKKFYPAVDEDDMIADALEHLWAVTDYHDEALGQWVPYALFCIKRKLYTRFNYLLYGVAEDARRNEAALNFARPLSMDVASGTMMVGDAQVPINPSQCRNAVVTTPESIMVSGDKRMVETLLSTLDSRAMDIVHRTIVMDWSLEDVAREYGLTRERVRQIRNESIETMRIEARDSYGYTGRIEVRRDDPVAESPAPGLQCKPAPSEIRELRRKLREDPRLKRVGWKGRRAGKRPTKRVRYVSP